MFELERLVIARRPCDDLAGDVGEVTEAGYHVGLTCSCGGTFERWVTRSDADEDLLRSQLSVFPQ